MPLPAIKADREFMVEACKKTPDYIENFGIRPPPTTVRQGLDKVVEGLNEMREGKISATRLVYKI